jgi:hypothetical protein
MEKLPFFYAIIEEVDGVRGKRYSIVADSCRVDQRAHEVEKELPDNLLLNKAAVESPID